MVQRRMSYPLGSWSRRRSTGFFGVNSTEGQCRIFDGCCEARGVVPAMFGLVGAFETGPTSNTRPGTVCRACVERVRGLERASYPQPPAHRQLRGKTSLMLSHLLKLIRSSTSGG